MSGWQTTDAWVLASIGRFRRPCTLAQLVGAADHLNHAILQEDELEDALTRLTGAGLVRVFEGWRFELTDDGTMLTTGDAHDPKGQLDELLAQLANFEPGRTRVALPRGLLAAAVEDYQSR